MESWLGCGGFIQVSKGVNQTRFKWLNYQLFRSGFYNYGLHIALRYSIFLFVRGGIDVMVSPFNCFFACLGFNV
ncbi:hypothetical protein VNO78_24596 [Psophocarpus tetragonolobus]|uniref:Uncharacterized protein n=1 Tax=Psophocarpus tetragonolobus TaxID=3891 RepID=A0AAN9S5N6_PSOTE